MPLRSVFSGGWVGIYFFQLFEVSFEPADDESIDDFVVEPRDKCPDAEHSEEK